jgi:anti-anti-sigma regulatory factor
MKKRAYTARANSPRRAAGPGTKRGQRARPGAAAGASALALPSECTLAHAETLKLSLAVLLKSVKPVTVDVRGVRRIDTASMQLLAAFARDRRLSELPVRVSGESAAFDEAARLLGLRELLRTKSGAPGSRVPGSSAPGSDELRPGAPACGA